MHCTKRLTNLADWRTAQLSGSSLSLTNSPELHFALAWLDVELIVGAVVKLDVLPLGRRADFPHGPDGLSSTYRKSLREIADFKESKSAPASRTSENAVKTQVWVALSVYVLVAIVKRRLGLDLSLYKILQILSVTSFEKTPILQGFSDFMDGPADADPCIQLSLFDL